jgi:hypothetical protein
LSSWGRTWSLERRYTASFKNALLLVSR